MREKTLIDTSAWIQALRSDGDPTLRDQVAGLTAGGNAVLCDFVMLELWNGARGDPERQLLQDLETELELLETDRAVWDLATKLAGDARTGGKSIPATDILIAACARRHDASLLHRDKHFDMIALIP